MTTFAVLFAGVQSSSRRLRTAGDRLARAEAAVVQEDIERARPRLLRAADRYGRALCDLSLAWDAASYAMPPLPGQRTEAEAFLVEGSVENLEDMIDGWIVHGLLARPPEGVEIDARATVANMLRRQPNRVRV